MNVYTMTSTMMEELNIVELIERNPITKLSNSYNGKMLTKIKNVFTEGQQQLFVASFYCYLNYNSKTDFVIDFDKVWNWLGFTQKVNAKRVLLKHFTQEIHYKCLLFPKEEQTNGRGGHNKETIMLTVKTFKSLCLKSDTKKADEIHEYFIKMEEILQEVIEEEGSELKLQLQEKDEQLQEKEKLLETTIVTTEKEKEELLERTLLLQFPLNTQCIYYGKIDNKSGGKEGSKMYHEDLIKFGQSNNLSERIKCHKKNFMNFRLVAAFKVKNKIEIENAIKRHPVLKKRIRSLTTIPSPNFKEETYRELLALDSTDFTIEKIDEYFMDIIKKNEYNIENYNKLVETNHQLETMVRDLEHRVKEKETENEKLRLELEHYKSDITTFTQKKIASNYAECKFGYYLYAFECEPMRYKCSISRQKDFEQLTANLTQIDPLGSMKYYVKVTYPFSEKIMAFLLKQTMTLLGNNKFEGAYEDVKKVLDITSKLENVLIQGSTDLDRLFNLLEGNDVNNSCNNNTNSGNGEIDDPETPKVRKAKRSIDQIDVKTGEIIKTFESIESAGRSLGLTTGTAIGIALREKRQCQGFLWRYTGITKEDQYLEQPVIKVCCNNGQKTCFNNIADAARDIKMSAPGLRQRILTNVHIDGHHWIFDKTSTHYT